MKMNNKFNLNIFVTIYMDYITCESCEIIFSRILDGLQNMVFLRENDLPTAMIAAKHKANIIMNI